MTKRRMDELAEIMDGNTEYLELCLIEFEQRLKRSKERLTSLELWATGHGYQHPDWPSHSQT